MCVCVGERGGVEDEVDGWVRRWGIEVRWARRVKGTAVASQHAFAHDQWHTAVHMFLVFGPWPSVASVHMSVATGACPTIDLVVTFSCCKARRTHQLQYVAK